MQNVDNDLLAKYTAKAIAANPQKSDDYDDLLTKYSSAALQAKQKKEEQKQEKKIALRSQPPEQRLTLAIVKELYKAVGITPSRNIYWFHEDLPLIQQSYLDDETRKIGSPFGALVLHKASQLASAPEWIKNPTNTWYLGSVAQITGFSTSYIQGFNCGFDGHAPGHRLCSYYFHCGYADGKVIATNLQKENLLAETESEDPFREIDNENDLNELIRVKGYWRDEWGPKPKYLLDTTDLTNQRLQELGLPLLEETSISC